VKDKCSRYYSNLMSYKEAARRLNIPTNLEEGDRIQRGTEEVQLRENVSQYCKVL
tara:strand:+ start:179 stop:343 length:165 start_codon:yes stop_codon:yes gene_type:complete